MAWVSKFQSILYACDENFLFGVKPLANESHLQVWSPLHSDHPHTEMRTRVSEHIKWAMMPGTIFTIHINNCCHWQICIKHLILNRRESLRKSFLFVQVKKLRQGKVEKCVQSHTTCQSKEKAPSWRPSISQASCSSHCSLFKAWLLTLVHMARILEQFAHAMVCKSCGWHCDFLKGRGWNLLSELWSHLLLVPKLHL